MTSLPFTNVIVTFNNRSDIAGLLADLRQHAPGSRTVLVDNASPDETANLVQSEFPEVHLVRNDVNVGYARAVNQGFALADTPYVFLLNPDIRVESAAVFSALRECLDDNAAIAVAGPLQFKDGGRRQHLNFTWSYWTPQAFRIYLAYLLGRAADHSGSVRVSFLNAGCLFIRRSAFDTVGRLNEKYFLYGEEPDLFFKLMRFGYECRLVPGASVTHTREQSLRSVPSLRRLMFKAAGVRNIADAVIRGLANLTADRLLHRKPS
jgi:N-acetylglucosaminyl-diphospho-decaprenol L-rhamnosyltransferase